MSMTNEEKKDVVRNIFDTLINFYGLDGIEGLARFLDVKYQTLKGWERRGNIADIEPFLFKCQGINVSWLKTGKGDMFSSEHIQILQDIAEGDTCQHVDIFNMVAAGDGAEPEWHEPIDRRVIPTAYLKNGVRPVMVRGRSMEPTFKNGAVIGIDEKDKHVIGGEAYAVLLPYEGAVVKRIYPVPDGVLIRSDNKEFPEVKLLRNEIPDYFILGRVCWVVQEV